MTTEQIVGILGLLMTVVFGALSVYLFFTRRYPGQITLVRESTIALFDSIVKNFSNLTVLYNTLPVSEGLVLLKGAFVNTGSKDISKDMVRENLCLRLPEKFTWRSAKVVSSSPSVHAEAKLSSQDITFDIDLFRCKEFVRFEAVVEVPVGTTGQSESGQSLENRLHRALQVRHRIADTQKVKVREFPDEVSAIRQIKKLWFPSTMSALMVGFVLGMLYFYCPARLYYTITDKGEQIEVKITPRTDDSVSIEGVSRSNYRKIVPTKDFFANSGMLARSIPDRSKIIILLVMIGVLLCCVPALFLMNYSGLWQAKRLRKTLGLDGNTQ